MLRKGISCIFLLKLKHNSNDVDVKIADFGFAKYAENDHSLVTQCGTPTYVAPEVICGVPYGTKVDMWSLGVILYALLGGYPPFYDEDRVQQLQLIKEGKFEFHEDYFDCVSCDAKDLITMLLVGDPSKRLSAEEALESNWIQSQ